MPAIRELVLVYALAGVDCIDVAADPAVIAAAQAGLELARKLRSEFSPPSLRHHQGPWLMISLNDGEDPHFRKASFNPHACPTDCPRPCQSICPTNAIRFNTSQIQSSHGVITDLCYGCGRCLPICPIDNIIATSHRITPDTLIPLIRTQVDAIEIHTQVGRQAAFQQLWINIQSWCSHLKVVAISCPYQPGVISYLQDLYQIIQPHTQSIIWQTDGRPMSGDIGKGTTQAAIRFAREVLASTLPGYIQLAGGTNQYTVEKVRALGLLKSSTPQVQSPSAHFPQRSIAGIAYGSYARKLIMPFLNDPSTPDQSPSTIESAAPQIIELAQNAQMLKIAVAHAHGLVAQLKQLPAYS